MAKTDYDLICVGGGLAGASLAKAMAERGARVLLLEREKQFHDRVRGEALMPWGVAEAKALGIFDLLISACGHCNQWAIGLGPDRDLVATTIQGLPILSFYHPAMQETLIAAAQGAGAETRRGATTQSATPGAPSIVEFECDGHATRVSARLVVGADGRASNVRKWGKFAAKCDPDRMQFAGVFMEEAYAPRQDANYMTINPSISQCAAITPQRTRPDASVLRQSR